MTILIREYMKFPIIVKSVNNFTNKIFLYFLRKGKIFLYFDY